MPSALRATLVLGIGFFAGCEPMPYTGNVFAPVRDELPAAPSTAGGEPAPLRPGEFDFEREDRPSTEEPGESAAPPDKDGAALSPEEMISGMGITPSEEKDGKSAATPPMPPPMPMMQGFGPPPGAWGVRVLSTVVDAQPPRAILGFADGTEMVVTPGTMVPGARVVVLAIGRDAVQVAEVTPEGDHARVNAQTLTALFPGR